MVFSTIFEIFMISASTNPDSVPIRNPTAARLSVFPALANTSCAAVCPLFTLLLLYAAPTICQMCGSTFSGVLFEASTTAAPSSQITAAASSHTSMKTTKGKLTIDGKDITDKWPDELRRNGIGIIPEDRYAQGLCADMSLSDNCIAGYHSNPQVCSKAGFMKRKKINELRDKFVKNFDIRVGSIDGSVGQLSGGNAQKVIIAREFESNSKLLIACQPTRGVDIGSIEFIHKQILAYRDRGNAVILISSELSEIMSLSTRIAVMYKGEIVGEVNPKETNTTAIGLLMAGIKN